MDEKTEKEAKISRFITRYEQVLRGFPAKTQEQIDVWRPFILSMDYIMAIKVIDRVGNDWTDRREHPGLGPFYQAKKIVMAESGKSVDGWKEWKCTLCEGAGFMTFMADITFNPETGKKRHTLVAPNKPDAYSCATYCTCKKGISMAMRARKPHGGFNREVERWVRRHCLITQEPESAGITL